MIRNRFLLIIFTIFVSFFNVLVLADDQEDRTILTISASAEIEVLQDLLVTKLYYKTDDTDSRKVQNDINDKMNKAIMEAKKYNSIDISTEQYYVYQSKLTDKKNKEKKKIIWQGSQSILLKSKDTQSLVELTSKLQSMGLAVSNMSYVVSSSLMENTQDKLLGEAIKKLLMKAEGVAKLLNKSETKLLTINTDPSQNITPLRSFMTLGANAPSPMHQPVAIPAKSTISINVGATLLIK